MLPCIFHFRLFKSFCRGRGWLLNSFTIKKVQGVGTDSGFTFSSGQWFEEERTINFGKYSGGTGAFYVEVKTSDISKAGTDSNIFLTIYGDKGYTKEINIGTYAQGGDNFERNDKDCFNIGYDVNEIGTINKITIKKDNKGTGPNWHLSYIKITEEVANGQSSQSVTFNINQWIENTTYTFGSDKISSSVKNSDGFIDRDILQGLTKNDDGSYTLVVNRNVNMSNEVFDFLAEDGVILTVVMKNDDGEMIYSLTFDGQQITNHHNIELKKGYSFSDGNAIIDFLAGAALPTGTTVAINTELLGFTNSDSLALFSKNEDGEWEEILKLINEDGVVEFSIEEGKSLLINNGSPLPEDGETELEDGFLTLKAQTNSSGSQLRFITTIDTLAYKEVGFVITNADNPTQTTRKTSKTVYTSIVAGGETLTAADISGDEDMNYILTFTITGITAETQSTRYIVKPFVVTLEGETIYGTENTFCVADMIA